jgi:hypothetical protein
MYVFEKYLALATFDDGLKPIEVVIAWYMGRRSHTLDIDRTVRFDVTSFFG